MPLPRGPRDSGLCPLFRTPRSESTGNSPTTETPGRLRPPPGRRNCLQRGGPAAPRRGVGGASAGQSGLERSSGAEEGAPGRARVAEEVHRRADERQEPHHYLLPRVDVHTCPELRDAAELPLVPDVRHVRVRLKPARPSRLHESLRVFAVHGAQPAEPDASDPAAADPATAADSAVKPEVLLFGGGVPPPSSARSAPAREERRRRSRRRVS